MSISVIVIINRHQYYKIVRPFHQFQCESTKIVYLIMALVWSTLALTSSLIFLVYRGTLLLNIYYALIFLIVLIVYIILCWSQYKISRECALINARDNTQESKCNLKAANMAKSVLIAFSISFVPLMIIFPMANIMLKENANIASFAETWATVLLLANPLFDPLAYCIRLTTVRNFIFSRFCLCTRSQRRITVQNAVGEIQTNSSV